MEIFEVFEHDAVDQASPFLDATKNLLCGKTENHETNNEFTMYLQLNHFKGNAIFL